ncbi:DsbA family oxidoreductase [Acidisoma sp. C75]
MLAFSRPPISVEIVYDIVCPWCFIGTRRLLRAGRRRPELSLATQWRPFLLNPDMPRAGMPWADYVLRKFGSHERARRLQASITEIGRLEGIAFRFDRILTMPSSVDAHRLVAFAAEFGCADQMADVLFTAHFVEGRDLGHRGELLDLGRQIGLPLLELRELLAGDRGVDHVYAENLRAHRLGINGAPCFILGRRHAIAGAQEPEVLECLLKVAAQDNGEE